MPKTATIFTSRARERVASNWGRACVALCPLLSNSRQTRERSVCPQCANRRHRPPDERRARLRFRECNLWGIAIKLSRPTSIGVNESDDLPFVLRFVLCGSCAFFERISGERLGAVEAIEDHEPIASSHFGRVMRQLPDWRCHSLRGCMGLP